MSIVILLSLRLHQDFVNKHYYKRIQMRSKHPVHQLHKCLRVLVKPKDITRDSYCPKQVLDVGYLMPYS